MNLNTKLSQLLDETDVFTRKNAITSVDEIMSLIDLTLLDAHATPHDLFKLVTKANHWHIAATCVLPEHLGICLPVAPIKRATVVNFPMGNQPEQLILSTIERLAATYQVDEIDYVFPSPDYLNDRKTEALSHCQHAYECCKRLKITFKVILETGALPSMDVIYELSTAILNNGCDFLKTSTGKIHIGATIPAAFSILSAIKDSNVACGIKVSGGIKTIEQACNYIQLAEYVLNRSVEKTWFRLGTSSLLDDLISKKVPNPDVR